MLDFDEVSAIVSDLTALNFFPGDDSGRLAVVNIVGNLASSVEQVRWLVDRMLVLYDKWPGPAEMRVCFCSRFKPADGIESHRSSFFKAGIPPINPAPPLSPLIPVGEARALLAAVESWADTVTLPALPASPPPVKLAAVRSMRARSGPRPHLQEVPNSNFKPITAEDVARAVEELHQRREKAG